MIPEGPPQRPGTAFGLGLSGAIIIVVGSLFFLLIPFSFLGVFALIGLGAGSLALAGSILMYVRPNEHIGWGVVVLVGSAVSIVGLGGFGFGMILGVLGGALGIAWKPQTWEPYAPMGPYGVPVMPWRMCMGCGRWVPWTYNICPLCGHQAPVAPWAPRADLPPREPGYAAGATTPFAVVPPAAPVARAPCPTCTGEAEWIAAHQRWYCPNEKRYF